MPLEVLAGLSLGLTDPVWKSRHILRVQETVVVPGYDDFVSMRQRREPVKLRLQLLEGAVVGKVAGVQEKIAVGDLGLSLFPQNISDSTMPWEIFHVASIWKSRGIRLLRCKPPSASPESSPKASDTKDSHLPPPPRILLANRVVYEIPLLERSRNRSVERDTDRPLAALYRIYEHIVLDQHIEIRNEIEAFWYHADWAVRDIPDPCDPHPERYACLACIPALLCLAFNKRIGLGLPRDAPPIFTQDMLEEWRAQERAYEEEPAWVNDVPRLAVTLAIPHWDNNRRDFVCLESFENRASTAFSRKNILIWQPHIHFA
ncbi:hypothetical protein DV738_g2077, partial [Chaetothyriales sp. CBS 135597]